MGMVNDLVACEFCSGAGGLSEGLEQAGLKVAFANEINGHAAMTYSFNHPSTFLANKDMKEVNSDEVIDVSGKEVFLVAAGLPCQGFSMAGKRDLSDPRNRLFRQFLRIAGRIVPNNILIENVPSLLSFNKGKTINAIERILKDMGYFSSKRVLNAADFGTPQNRRRLIIIGSVNKNVDINALKLMDSRKVTVKDAISDLDFLGPGEYSYYYEKSPENAYQRMIREGSSILFNHESPNHSKIVMKRFHSIKSGNTIKDIPQALKTKKIVLYRLKAGEIARTVTTLPDDYIHYKRNRILTVREMARLQGVRDSYIFLGPRTTGGKQRKTSCPQYSQVGNMVSPIFAKAIGEWLVTSF